MVSFRSLGLIALATSLLPTPLAALAQNSAEQRAPISDWSLEYAEDSCVLRRAFGSEETPTWLEIRQVAPNQAYRMTVASWEFDRRRRRYPVATFLPGGREHRYPLAAFGEYGDGGEGVVWYQRVLSVEDFPSEEETPADFEAWHAAELARRSEITSLRLSNAFDDDIDLQTGSLSAPLTALDECTINLMHHLGIDWNGIEIAPDVLNTGEWAGPIIREYPTGMLRSGIEGSIYLRVLVDAEGAPTDCLVQEPVVDADYEEFVCDIVMARARYNPARNAAGEAVAGVNFQRIVYAIN